MTDDQTRSKEQRKDFFISYTSTDRRWAEWIAWYLEEAGYSTMLQAWDFHAGGNFVVDMDTATLNTESVQEVYKQITSLPFVEQLPWGATYQDLTRQGLLKYYAHTQPELLKITADTSSSKLSLITMKHFGLIRPSYRDIVEVASHLLCINALQISPTLPF